MTTTAQLYQVVVASFEAARFLPFVPLGHRARRWHGHSFNARVAGVGNDAQVIDLSSKLTHSLAPLDYSLLNDHFALPTDAHLARWLHQRLDLPVVVEIQSTPHQGVTLNHNHRVDFWRGFRFEAAHQLPRVAPGHPCGRMHGHGFAVMLHATPGPDDAEFDGDLLTAMWQPLQDIMDGSCLNYLPGLENPTSEVLAYWIWQALKPRLPQLSRVTIHETVTAGCQYDGVTYRVWKTLRFESSLRAVYAGNNTLHGHSYVLRLYLSAPLDTMMGWTMDYGEIKERFNAIHEQLDHNLLNEVPGLTNPNLDNLAYWIRDQAQPLLPWLNRIDLNMTPQRGIILTWATPDPILVFAQ